MHFLIFSCQKAVFWIFYFILRPFIKRTPHSWVVGVDENCGNIHNLSNAIPNAVSVCLKEDSFYKFHYNFSIPTFSNRYLHFLLRIIYSPVLFAVLVIKHDYFMYTWSTGFFLSQHDGRYYEFKTLKKLGKKIVCYFCGSDIRSPMLARKYAIDHDIDVTSTYYDQLSPSHLTEKYERQQQRIALSAEKFSDTIFSSPVDSISYLTRSTFPFIYFYPDEKYNKYNEKYEDIKIIKILHAPSSPIFKGTQLVRAAIKKLKIEGMKFEYRELFGVPNEEVLFALKESHIVLNQFYSIGFGLFGIEALASHCALLTSADVNIDTSLPQDAEGAWLVTRYWQVYDNIKFMLNNPEEIKKYADKGFEWAQKHYSFSNAQKTLLNILKKEGFVI